MRALPVEVILVAHEEEAAIGAMITGFLQAAEGSIDLEILVAEDGSADGTREVVAEIAKRSGERVRLTPAAERKGYSRALVDACRLARREVIAFCDGDGQYDPADLLRLVTRVSPGTIVVGVRTPRRDAKARMIASSAFGLAYRLMFRLRLNDPSSPYVAAHRDDVLEVLPALPVLPQGFWWEFYARADAAGLRIVEVPVAHRARADGTTRVYRPLRIPRIAIVHLAGLVRLRRELNRSRLEPHEQGAAGASAVGPG
jgi:glycosyltransferase involved in cell wall biosynthesis